MDNKLILIVEDEPSIREMVRFALQRADFRVAEAGDAQSARVQIAEAHPDLVLMDWMMPGVSGVELARELKAAPLTRDLPIIMVTARTEEEDRVRGLNIGCDDYVTKPRPRPTSSRTSSPPGASRAPTAAPIRRGYPRRGTTARSRGA